MTGGRTAAQVPSAGPRRLRRGLLAVAALLALYGAARLLAGAVPLPERLSVPGSRVIEYRDGTVAHLVLAPDGRTRIDASLERVDPAYVKALLALEDERFFWHPGVDPLAIVRALRTNLARGRVVSGASTITMQLVRVLEPRPRTLTSKVIEAVRAVQLELVLGKEPILAAYLTFAPFGRNVEGVEAASWACFGHGAERLSSAEIATLLSIPQDPTDRYPSPAHGEALRKARDEVARRLIAADALSLGEGGVRITPAELLNELRRSPVPARLTPFPRAAPHAASWLFARNKASRIRTTLDAGAQRTVEALAKRAQPELAAQGAHNASIVVVDHAAAELRALVGNPDFFDDRHGGQLNGFVTPRSSGSTLKPFLFALAIDRGLALPETLVSDVPLTAGAFSPKNFDGGYSGLVRLDEALSRSLNVPFVSLLGEVGVENFLGQLRSAGVTSLVDTPGHYGLSAAIGGLELPAIELAGLYVALAQDGRHRPLRLLEAEPIAPPMQWLSPGASYLTRRSLSRKDRPDFPSRAGFTGLPPRVHWKTGTSYGFRDAWAAGSDATHTVVVWVGNFDARPAPAVTGTDGAGPLFFRVIEALGVRDPPAAPPPPAELSMVKVCAFSGHVPGPACEEQRHVLARAVSVPTTPCPYHVHVDVDVATGLAVAPGCREGSRWERRSFVALPSGVRRFLATEARAFREPPSRAPGCGATGTRAPPRIASPPLGQIAVLMPDVPPDRQEVPLEAETAASELSWFVGGEFLGTFPAGERVFWTPKAGAFEIVAIDDAGLTARRTLKVVVARR